MLRAKAVCIDNYSIEALADGINETISEDAAVVTDRWCSYIRTGGECWHLDILSDKGKSMPEIRTIFNAILMNSSSDLIIEMLYRLYPIK